jgi:hypothetical protein
MAAGSWNSVHLPGCRAWLISSLERVRRMTKATFAHRAKLVQRGILLSIGFVVLGVAGLAEGVTSRQVGSGMTS